MAEPMQLDTSSSEDSSGDEEMDLDRHLTHANTNDNAPNTPISGDSKADNTFTSSRAAGNSSSSSGELKTLVNDINKYQHRVVVKRFKDFLRHSKNSVFTQTMVNIGMAYTSRMEDQYLRATKSRKVQGNWRREFFKGIGLQPATNQAQKSQVGEEGARSADIVEDDFQFSGSDSEDNSDIEELDGTAVLRKKRNGTLIKELKAIINELLEEAEDDMKPRLQLCMNLCKVAADNLNREKKLRSKPIQGPWPETAEEVNDRLQSSEEDKNPWGASKTASLPNGGLFMRVWDKRSQCQWTHLGIQSGGSTSSFKTKAGRMYDLILHLHWGSGDPTPFISTGSCLNAVDRRVKWFLGPRRKSNPNGPITLKYSVINGNARIAAGWPIISMFKQIGQYNIEDKLPEIHGKTFYLDEFLMPFRIRKQEVVGTWCWYTIEGYMLKHNCDFKTWHNEVAVPAFNEHEAARLEGRDVRFKGGCSCCGHSGEEKKKAAQS